MDIGFFFTFEGEVVQLPINPPEIEVAFKGRNKQIDIIGLGEITLIQKRALANLKFKTFLPGGTWFPGIRTLGLFKDPTFYKDFFERVYQGQKPMRLTITGLNISMDVTLEDFKYTHSAGEEEDPTIEMDMKEYKYYKIDVISVTSTTTGGTTTATVEKPKASTPARPATQVTVGATVALTGRVCVDSAGGKPGKTFSGTDVKVTLIKKGAANPYHVATLSGGPLGWVTESAVKLK